MKHLLLQAAFLLLSLPAPAQTTHPGATHKTVTYHAGAKVKTMPASGPQVYYCTNGNTAKYHAAPGCRGLVRCGAAVVPLVEAQQQQAPCK